jgi:Tc5 transposase DNA-binding domain
MSDYLEAEERVQDALLYKQAHPSASLRFLSRSFNVPKDRIYRRLKGQDSRSTRPPTNQKLDKDQDLALCWYVESLHRIGVSLRYKAIAQAANQILAASHHLDDPPPTVGEHWPSRWLKTHPQYTVVKERPIEAERQQAMNATEIRRFFNQFERVKTEHQIEVVDIWNMDESGFRVGVGRGQWVIIPIVEDMDHHRFTHLIGSLGDTEHLTVIESISAGAVTIDPFIIIKGTVIQLRWFADLKSRDIAIGVSESGYSNDELSFLWLQQIFVGGLRITLSQPGENPRIGALICS